MTPAEERVYLDFCSWVDQFTEDSCWGVNPSKNSVFFYANMNTGESIVFVLWHGYEDFHLRDGTSWSI